MDRQSPLPIFYDRRHRRWTRFKRSVQCLMAVFSSILATLLVSILVNPVLPSLGLPAIRTLPQVHHLALPQPQHVGNHSERRFERTKQKLHVYLTKDRPVSRFSPVRPPPAGPQPSELIGFYVN